MSNDSDPSYLERLYSRLAKDLNSTLVASAADTSPKFPLLKMLSCANVDAQNYNTCDERGKLACSSCKLVSYCSKECQKAHWAVHKSDCKHPIRSVSWQPAWIRERRDPSFLDHSDMSSAEEFVSLTRDRLSLGTSLWGNIPAIDIVNLLNNEKDPKTDLTIAFAASGDIRNVIATVNALGSGYSGLLKIFLNDINPRIVSRNIALLLILGTLSDEVLAADIALHFWYSVFLPAEYRYRIQSLVSSLLKKWDPASPMVTHLGPRAMLTCLVSPDVCNLMKENISDSMTADQAQAEYHRVRSAPSRADFRDRMYKGLRPSHRLAFLKYRQHGIILPFGAPNVHCNVPNPSFFSNGEWLQTDYADPLGSWDLDEVFSAGKAHGAQPEDVYGCLYFYLSNQLRAFARQLRQHHVAFYVFSTEACSLAQYITEGNFAEWGIPPTIRFNRIDVSNIMDANYAGIPDVIDSWGPLLAKTDNAAVTGYLMNWAPFTEKGRAVDASQSTIHHILELMKKSNRLHLTDDPRCSMFLTFGSVDAFYDNSKAFAKYWKSRGGADIKLHLRTLHKIVPHRLKSAIDAKLEALPKFADDEAWYRHSRLLDRTWTERYVELCHRKVANS